MKRFVLLVKKLQKIKTHQPFIEIEVLDVFLLLEADDTSSASEEARQKFEEIKKDNILIIEEKLSYLEKKSFSGSPYYDREKKKFLEKANFWSIAEIFYANSTFEPN